MTLCLSFDLVGELNVLSHKCRMVCIMCRICLYTPTGSDLTRLAPIVVLLLGPIHRPIFSYLPG